MARAKVTAEQRNRYADIKRAVMSEVQYELRTRAKGGPASTMRFDIPMDRVSLNIINQLATAIRAVGIDVYYSKLTTATGVKVYRIKEATEHGEPHARRTQAGRTADGQAAD